VRALRWLGLLTFVGFFVVAGTVFGAFYWGSKELRDAFMRNWRDPLRAWTPERQFPRVAALNLLVLGVDRDLDNRRRPMKTNGRSDSILVARVDFANKTINALTIPRDTAVSIPGRRGLHKINGAHNFGGPPLTAETVQAAFGIPTDAYVTINFEGFCKVVDAIGGVDINVAKRLKYDDNWGGLHINLYPGFQHLNGYQAMGYVRMRHSDNDEMRSKRQHEFLEAVRTKLRDVRTLRLLPGAVDQLADSLKRSPNLSKDQMYTLVNFARSLPRSRVHVETLPSVEGRSYVSVKRREAQEAIRRIFFPDRLVDVQLDVPDPDTVAGMNGEHRRRSSRRSARSDAEADASDGPSSEESPIQVPEADQGVTGDGLSGSTPAGDGTGAPEGRSAGGDSGSGSQ